ncbi:MAG: hypothetical protein M0024_10415 [Nitrospiraceae bacterium]|nr:hypothetical protein [Nitrospiraceae bacterium]
MSDTGHVRIAVTIEELEDIANSLQIAMYKVDKLSERLLTQRKRELQARDIINDFVIRRYGDSLEWITEYRDPENTAWHDAIEELEADIADTNDCDVQKEMAKELELLRWAINAFTGKVDGLWIRYD